MDILLWRWSTAVQLTSAFMIAVFFIALSRSIHRPEVVWWRRAWIANLCALLVTLAFWYFNPASRFATKVVSASYLATKTAFIVLLIEGAGAIRLSARAHWIAIGAFAVTGALIVNNVPMLGIVQHGTMAAVFFVAAILLSRHRERRVAWFVGGLLVRALLALAEAAAYSTVALNGPLHGPAGSFVSASSSFDTGAEWLLALGCVLMISERIQSELRGSNRDLLTAQEELRALADRDPLTGLANRRSLPALFRSVQPHGATVLFFDLDDFKEINDLNGHGAGDDCLREFATALLASFRPDDGVIRYGGDEFVVIAAGLDPASIDERLMTLRRKSNVKFSVGFATLEAHGVPDEALQRADQAMYAAKADRTLRRRSRRR